MLPAFGHDQSAHAALEIWCCLGSRFIDRLGFVISEVINWGNCQTKPRGFIATGVSIVQRETPLALYKGLGAVLAGIVPKMAIRFASFEMYKSWLANKETGKTGVGGIFFGAASLLDMSLW